MALAAKFILWRIGGDAKWFGQKIERLIKRVRFTVE
jgi:hypothetical protein